MTRMTCTSSFLFALAATAALGGEPSEPTNLTEREAKHLANLRQVTRGLPRAGEGYFSRDAKSIVYQAYPVGYPFYQIYTQSLENGEPRLVSTGRGRTT